METKQERALTFSVKNKKGWNAAHSCRMRLIVMARDEVGGRKDGESVN